MSLDGAATEGVKALCVCLSRQINYQKQLKTNMEALENRKCALIAKNDDIVRRVDRDKLQARSALNEVSNWLQEVESIKGKVSDIQKNFEKQKKCWKGLFLNYYRRRKISKKSSELIGQMDKLITDGRFENGVTIESLPLATNALPMIPIVGKTSDLTRQEILDCILGTETRIIGVHGMGGVGKTTIMKNINNHLIKSKHFDCVVWITVSKDVDVYKLQRKIAKELKIVIEVDDDNDSAGRKIFDALECRKKFLLILDDTWDAFNLDEVGIPIPSEENGCKVVLTTRDLGVCRWMQAHAIEVRVLSKVESWEFFKNIVGGVIFSKDVENLAKDVVKECCNLPLAIKTVGGSLCGVDNAYVWKHALKNLKEANGKFEGIYKVFAPLKFSYTQLCDRVLQSCFLYCSLYPEDHEITANELIDNWICEGLIDGRGTREDNINEGHTILDRLIKVSMLEKCKNHGRKIRAGDEICVKMHDLIRDMAIDITRAENPRSLIYASWQLKDIPAELTELQEDAVRISLMYNEIKELSGQPSCQHLLTLLLQHNPLQKISPNSYFNHMCSLRVLDLSSTWIESLPDSVSNLKQLRALILSRCSGLKELPSLEELKELRVLDLNSTNIRELPSGVEVMVYLQRLDLDRTKQLRVFPAGIIPRLSRLEELTMGGSIWKWSSQAGEGAGIEEIMNSTRLAILNIQFEEMSDFLQHARSNKWQTMTRFCLAVGRSVLPAPMFECSCVEIGGCNLEENQLLLPDTTQRLVISDCQISSLWHFTRLLHKSELYRCEIGRCKNMEYIMAEEEPLLPDIKELNISYSLELLVLCKGIPSPDALKSLESLIVVGCHKLKYLLPARLLQQLRCLKIISVKSCGQMKEIVGEEEEMGITREDDNNAVLELSQLQSLVIIHLPKLMGISSRVLICNALETININNCYDLKKLPFSVDNLPCALKEIEGDKEWWDAVEWDHPQTKAHFDSRAKLRSSNRAWHIGPVSLCNRDQIDMAERGKKAFIDTNQCLDWLSSRQPGSVLYCMSDLIGAQLMEIALALEASGHPFIWVVRNTDQMGSEEEWMPNGFEERMKGKGLIIRGWAPQVIILNHPAVGGFVTHCGWNSMMEAVSAGVPMVTWPRFAELFYNEKLITRVLRIGVEVGAKVWARSKETRPMMGREEIERAVAQLMGGGDEADERRRRARELGEMVKKAVKNDGSSYMDRMTVDRIIAIASETFEDKSRFADP